MRPFFSSRASWNLAPNRLAAAAEARRRRGGEILDLAESNPTRCGLVPEGEKVLEAFARGEILRYEPDPRGLLLAREAVSALYRERGVELGADRIVLTSSTSEAYAHLFRLLADPGEEVLVPSPCYPLFDLLAQINDVRLRPYPLVEEDGFRIDLERLEEAAGAEGARAVLVVNPGNPTGTYLRRAERDALARLCARRGLALVSDEVFSDFEIVPGSGGAASVAGETRALTFVLNGISKMLALPQMKLGWIAASGPPGLLAEALGRLEVIADTYLSVNTPVQAALPDLLALRPSIQLAIRGRLAANLRTAGEILAPPHPVRVLPVEGGWSVVLRVPSTRSDETWALDLLEQDGVLVHPGFFFDFPCEGRLVVSLLPEEAAFRDGIARLARRIARADAGA